jgi:hypothetical protein
MRVKKCLEVRYVLVSFGELLCRRFHSFVLSRSPVHYAIVVFFRWAVTIYSVGQEPIYHLNIMCSITFFKFRICMVVGQKGS